MKKLLFLFAFFLFFPINRVNAVSQLTSNQNFDWSYNCCGIPGTIAQSFVADTSHITDLDLKLGKWTCPYGSPYQLRIKISPNTGLTYPYFTEAQADYVFGTMDCAALASETTGVVNIHLTNPIETTIGQSYFLKIASGDYGHRQIVARNTTNPYADGQMYGTFDGNENLLVAMTNNDLYFQTIDNSSPPPPTAPTLEVLTPEAVQNYNSPVVFSGRYDLNGFDFNHGLAEIHNVDLDLNQYFEFTASSTATGWQNFTTTKSLSDGNYDFSFFLFNTSNDATTTPSISHYFIVGTSTPFISVATNTPPNMPDFTDHDFGLLGNMFRDVIVWLFNPSQNAINFFTEIKDNLMTKSPFGYYTLARNKMTSISLASASSPTLTLVTHLGGGTQNMTLFDMSAMASSVGSTSMTLMYNLLKYSAWLGFLAFCYHEIKKIFSGTNL